MNIEKVFLFILNMSLTSSYVIISIILLRFFFKKAPKWINGVLWGIASIRLIFPFSFNSILSIFSIIPNSSITTTEILYSETPKINSGIPYMNSMVNPIISESMEPSAGASVNPMQVVIWVASIIWLIGIAVLFIYSITTYLKLKSRTAEATLLKDNIYQSENIVSPFMLGLIKPRIYIPYTLAHPQLSHVLSHECAHIQRRDYLLKPLAFSILALHWFNPIVWIAYLLFCKDIEMACDEKVIKNMDSDQRKSYSSTLLALAMINNKITFCPIAFGEVSVKDRVKKALSYKKPVFWVILVSLVVCIITATCLLTNPIKDSDNITYGEDITQLYGTYHPDEVIYVNPLSSFYPFDLDDTPYYTFVEDKVTIIMPSNNDRVTEIIESPSYTRVELTKDEFDDMLFFDINTLGISKCKNIEQISLSDRYSLFIMDTELWFANFNGDNLWIIYRLQPSEPYIPEDVQLTLEDLKELVENRGENLTWSDFEKYEHIFNIRSGSYTWQIPINDDFCVIVKGTGTDTEPIFVRLFRLSTVSQFSNYELELRGIDIDIQSFVAEAPQKMVWTYMPARSSVFPALPMSIDMDYDTVDVIVDNGSLYIHGSGETRNVGNDYTYTDGETIYWSPHSEDFYDAVDIAASCIMTFNIENSQSDIVTNGQINIQQISDINESGYAEYKVSLEDTSDTFKLVFDTNTNPWGSFVLSRK